MARLLIQSKATGRFLAPSPEDGQPQWVLSLREVGAGVLQDMDQVAQLVEDHCDHDDFPQVIDLDRVGTVNDYVGGN
jgi:hypothetical protein